MDSSAILPLHLLHRQIETPNDNDPDDSGSWWWTTTGSAVRYAIVAGLFILFLAYFLGGHWHARRRQARGLPPLPYHRWMVRRGLASRQRSAAYARAANYPAGGFDMGANPNGRSEGYGGLGYGGGGGMPEQPPQREYGFDAQGNVPPPYEAPPPTYQPPEGGSKALADQGYRGPVVTVGESSRM